MTRALSSTPLIALLITGLVAGVVAVASCGGQRPPRNVVIVTIDTLRPDRLSLYGYTRPTSPEIDALAARGVVFENAWSQAANTNPSIASALTSRRAPMTSVRSNAEQLAPEIPTIARAAHDAGWQTGAFVSTVLLRDDVCALDPGFDVYDDEMTDPCWGHDNAQRVARNTVDRALAWLAGRDERPFLLWVHLYDPHGPYTAPEPTPELDATAPTLPSEADPTTWLGPARIPEYLRVDGLTEPLQYADAYDREIRYADRHLGRLFAALDVETTYIAVHADHGEAHGEDSYWFRHGTLLHDAALRIPMIMVGPGIDGGRRIAARVHNLDLVPTLTALAGIPAISGTEGRDLGSALLDGDDFSGGWSIAEARRREQVADDTGIDVRWKLRHQDEADIDLTWWPAADERRVESGDAAAVVTSMERLHAWLRGPEDMGPDAVSAETEEALRRLGYVAPSETTTPRAPEPR